METGASQGTDHLSSVAGQTMEIENKRHMVITLELAADLPLKGKPCRLPCPAILLRTNTVPNCANDVALEGWCPSIKPFFCVRALSVGSFLSTEGYYPMFRSSFFSDPCRFSSAHTHALLLPSGNAKQNKRLDEMGW